MKIPETVAELELERVSTGLLCLVDGLEPEGREMLAAADRIAELYG